MYIPARSFPSRSCPESATNRPMENPVGRLLYGSFALDVVFPPSARCNLNGEKLHRRGLSREISDTIPDLQD